MNTQERDFLKIISAALTGQTAEFTGYRTEEEWKCLYKISVHQNLWPMIDQHGEPHGHRRAVGTAEPSGSSRSVGGHHRGQEAVARQRQPDAGVRGAVLRADSGEAMTAPGQERTTVEPRTINWGSSEMCAA